MSISSPHVRIAAFLGACLLFAGAFYQAPLFSSNQNTYFLNGLAHAGYGYLSSDWLALQTDHIPVFSYMVAFVHTYGGDWLFYILFVGLATTYAVSLSAIAARTFASEWRWQHMTVFLFMLMFFHCTWMLTPLAELIPGLQHVIPTLQKLIDMSTSGLAGQSILRPILQPSTFGVLILAGVACFLYRREFLAVACMVLAATVHPTFILHAAILTAACMFVLALEKRTKKALAVGVFSTLLVLPVLLYVALVLQPASPTQLAEAQSILVNERIPHHAKVSAWFSLGALLKIAIIVAGIAVSFRHKRLFMVLTICTATGLALSLLQVMTASTSLALLFPWRLSTWLVPACLAILLGGVAVLAVRLIQTWAAPGKMPYVHLGIVGLFITFAITGGVLGVKKTVEGALTAVQTDVVFYAKTHAQPTQTYLIPLKYEKFRLAAGVPVFIDWKSHPYRDVEVIEWHDRVALAKAFYEAKNSEIAAQALAAIQMKASITHVMVEKGQDCLLQALPGETIFQDDNYLLRQLSATTNR